MTESLRWTLKPGRRYASVTMSAPKPVPDVAPPPPEAGDDEVARRLENAPIDADAMTVDELAEVEACLAHEPASVRSTVEILDGIIVRAKREA